MRQIHADSPNSGDFAWRVKRRANRPEILFKKMLTLAGDFEKLAPHTES